MSSKRTKWARATEMNNSINGSWVKPCILFSWNMIPCEGLRAGEMQQLCKNVFGKCKRFSEEKCAEQYVTFYALKNSTMHLNYRADAKNNTFTLLLCLSFSAECGWLMTAQPAYTQGVSPSPVLDGGGDDDGDDNEDAKSTICLIHPRLPCSPMKL